MMVFRFLIVLIICFSLCYSNDDLKKNEQFPSETTNKLDTENNENKKDREAEQLEYLQRLRYDNFGLRQQLGNSVDVSLPHKDYINENESAKVFNTKSQSYNDGKNKSGLFVGLGIGGLSIYTSAIHNSAEIVELVQSPEAVTKIDPVIYIGKGGYQKFFNHYIGARLYGGLATSFFTRVYNYNFANGESNVVPNPNGGGGDLKNFYVLGFMSADLLFDFPIKKNFKHYIGAFAGLNIGIMYYRTYGAHPTKGDFHPAPYIWDYNLQVDYSFNGGVSLTLYDKHRIEIALSIPFAYLALPGFSASANNIRDERLVGQDAIRRNQTEAGFWRSAMLMVSYTMLLKFGK